MLSALLTTGTDGKWSPGIGDPTAIGWITVLAYFIAAYFAYRAFRVCVSSAHSFSVSDPAEAHAQRLLASLWFVVLIAMLLLGVNKQLDLQTLFTQLMRTIFFRLHLYEQRRTFQVAFIGAIALGALATVSVLMYVFWRVLNRAFGALIGLSVVVTFVVIRAASFHHVDLYLRSGPLPLNVLLELGGVVVLAVSGYRAAKAPAAAPAPSRPPRASIS
jgi:hypothetical protein